MHQDKSRNKVIESRCPQLLPSTANGPRAYLSTDWFQSFNELQTFPLFFFTQEGQQTTQPLFTLAVIQLIKVVVPEVSAALKPHEEDLA